MALGQFVQFLAAESGVSIVLSGDLDGEPVTIDVRDVPVEDVLGAVARRLGVQVVRRRSLYFVGEARMEDRAFLVRRVKRLDGEELYKVIEAVRSERGRVVVTKDGVAVIADTVDVLGRIEELLDRIESAQASVWVIQVYVVSLSQGAARDAGLDGQAAVRVSAGVAAASGGDLTKMASVSADLESLLRLARSESSSHVVAEPLLLLTDGQRGRVLQGRRVPIARRAVSDAGTVTTSGFDFIDVGFELDATLREQPGGARITMMVRLADVVGFVEGEAPITSELSVETVADVQASGVYLVGQVKRESGNDGKGWGLRNFVTSTRDDGNVMVWARVQRVAGPIQAEAK